MKLLSIILLACLFGAPQPQATPPRVKIAVIGDYGIGVGPAISVANLVQGWSPDAVITTGDNNYPAGRADTLDKNVGDLYGDPFIDNGVFWPSIGNHDLDWTGPQPPYKPLLDYCQVRSHYVKSVAGIVEVFAVNNYVDPDGTDEFSLQAGILRRRLLSSKADWQIVYFHKPPYASPVPGHSGEVDMRWDFAAWGADAVMAGHIHTYERLSGPDGIPYFIVGTGGAGLDYHDFSQTVPESEAIVEGKFGAVLIQATSKFLWIGFVDTDGVLWDEYIETK